MMLTGVLVQSTVIVQSRGTLSNLGLVNKYPEIDGYTVHVPCCSILYSGVVTGYTTYLVNQYV